MTELRDQVVNGASPEDMIDPLKSLAKQFGSIKGASKIKSQISKARRALRKKKPKIDKAITHLDNATVISSEQRLWRERALTEFLHGIKISNSPLR